MSTKVTMYVYHIPGHGDGLSKLLVVVATLDQLLLMVGWCIIVCMLVDKVAMERIGYLVHYIL